MSKKALTPARLGHGLKYIQRSPWAIYALSFGIIGGIIFLVSSHAAVTNSNSIYAHLGSLSGNASVVTDSNASDGSAVLFGKASTGAGGTTSEGPGGSDTSCVFGSAPAGTTAAFCDGFNGSNDNGGRTGDLNGVLWGASRLQIDWPLAQMTACGSTTTVTPPHDIHVCGGKLYDAMNDNATVAALAMYPKQPFDFANRTGTVVFDVSNDSKGNHAAWPEFWMSDKPVPTPFTHEETLQSVPRDGFGVRFAAVCGPNVGSLCGPGCTNSNATSVFTVDSVDVIRGYQSYDTFIGPNDVGNLAVKTDGCALEAKDATQMNHIELRVSQNQIDVYGTDAYSGVLDLSKTPLHHLATVMNAGLTLTKGLVWIEDAHYNADKDVGAGSPNQRIHTFAWDNVGFDGPKTYRDWGFDVADQFDMQTSFGSGLQADLRWYEFNNNETKNFTTQSVNKGIATSALLVMSFQSYFKTSWPITYSINGHSHTIAWPYPYTVGNSANTLDIPVDINEVVTGPNTIGITNSSGDAHYFVGNISLIMVHAADVP